VGELELRRGECAALLGPNGSGKTTFLKTLLGELEPLEGLAEVGQGASLKVGYFAQAHDGLNPEGTVLDELTRHKPMAEQAARNLLATYLFRGEDVFKPVGVLSGGERARLALAILATEGANLLLLDEPTNHLDIPAREALQAVLDEYPGSILLVSHDRYLVDQLATQVWEIRNGGLEIFQGSYRQFVLRKAGGSSPIQGRNMVLAPRPMLRDNSQETRRLALALEQAEERIHAQEKTIQRLSRELEKARGYEQVSQLGWELAEAQARLEAFMGEWERLAG
jgi:ATP-binding cassette subfamily F protein 3